jgi:hypothetical protein
MEHYIHERTTPIVIKNNTINTHSKELGLTNNVIDPFKMSPPNSFIAKLNARMDSYYSPDLCKQTTGQKYTKYHYVNVSTSSSH